MGGKCQKLAIFTTISIFSQPHDGLRPPDLFQTVPLIDAHRLKKERGSDSIKGLRKNSAGVFFAIYFATYSTPYRTFVTLPIT